MKTAKELRLESDKKRQEYIDISVSTSIGIIEERMKEAANQGKTYISYLIDRLYSTEVTKRVSDYFKNLGYTVVSNKHVEIFQTYSNITEKFTIENKYDITINW